MGFLTEQILMGQGPSFSHTNGPQWTRWTSTYIESSGGFVELVFLSLNDLNPWSNNWESSLLTREIVLHTRGGWRCFGANGEFCAKSAWPWWFSWKRSLCLFDEIAQFWRPCGTGSQARGSWYGLRYSAGTSSPKGTHLITFFGFFNFIVYPPFSDYILVYSLCRVSLKLLKIWKIITRRNN